jgi:methionyl-tRNA formyltransferase
MDIIFLGVTDVGMRIYEWLCDRDRVDVLAMITQKDQLSLIERQQPEMVVSVGYDYIIPPEMLSVPDRGCVNLHPAFLPYNRGRSPNVWSIVEDTPAGATLHYMDAGVDTGDIVARTTVEKRFDDTGKELHKRIENAQFDLFVEHWPDIESGEAEPVPQDESGTYHELSDFEELCKLDAEKEYTVRELLDRLRALTYPPFNNAHVVVDGEKYYIEVDIQHEDETGDESADGYLSSY